MVFSTPRKAFIYGLFRNFSSYSNSQSSICFMVLPQCFSFKTVHFRTVLHVFTMFLSNCIVILLSTICYTLKSTNNLKYYNIHKALPFPYKLKVIYFSSSLRPSSLHITCYPWYLILSTSVSFFRLLLKTQESTICNRPTKKIIIKIGTIGTW